MPVPGGEQAARMGSHEKKRPAVPVPEGMEPSPGHGASSRRPQRQRPREFSDVLGIQNTQAAQAGNNQDFTELFRLEKTLKVIRSNHQPDTAKSTVSEAMP